jgi:osmotically-inducible protein OsmY
MFKYFIITISLLLGAGCTEKGQTTVTVEPMKQPQHRVYSNSKLAHAITIAINQHEELNSQSTIRVIAKGHNVLLLGQVTEPQFIDMAQEIAYEQPGVHDVVNFITINGPLDPIARGQDLAIKTAINSNLRKHNLLKPKQSITVENKVAYIVGPHVFDTYAEQEELIRSIDDSISVIPVELE